MTDHRFTLLDVLFDQVTLSAGALLALKVFKQDRAERETPYCSIYLGETNLEPHQGDFGEPLRGPGALLGYRIGTAFGLHIVESETVQLSDITPIVLNAIDVLRETGACDAAWLLTGIGPPEDEIADVGDREQEFLTVECNWNGTNKLALRGS